MIQAFSPFEVLKVTKVTKSRPNSEADTPSSATTLTPLVRKHHHLRVRYTDFQSVETNQTAHISLQYPAMSNSARQKTNTKRQIFLAQTASTSSHFLLRSPWPRPLAPSNPASAAPVRGYLRSPPGTRNPNFTKNSQNRQKSYFMPIFQIVRLHRNGA